MINYGADAIFEQNLINDVLHGVNMSQDLSVGDEKDSQLLPHQISALYILHWRGLCGLKLISCVSYVVLKGNQFYRFASNMLFLFSIFCH